MKPTGGIQLAVPWDVALTWELLSASRMRDSPKSQIYAQTPRFAAHTNLAASRLSGP